MCLTDEARRIAYEELGHDRVNAGETAESYVNGMTNWEFLEFLTRVMLQAGGPACRGTPYYEARMEHINRSPNTTARNNMINFLTSLQEALLLERYAEVSKKLDYRPAPTKPSIDWKAVAPQYKYLARDKNGRAYLFKDAPFTGAFIWLPSRTGPAFSISLADAFVSYLPGDCDWKDSLVERLEE